MVVKWQFFFAAALLVGYFFVSAGVPWPSVLLGVGAVAAWNLYAKRRRPNLPS